MLWRIGGSVSMISIVGHVDDSQRHPASRSGYEIERYVLGGAVGSVLDGEAQALALPSQVQVGVPPCMEFAGAAQGLPSTSVSCVLAGVMDEHDRAAVSTLQLSQESEQRCDRSRHVLIDPVQPHEGVENQERGLHLGDGGVQLPSVFLGIDTDRRRCDSPEIQLGEVEPVMRGDAVEAFADDVGCVLRGIQQHAAWVGDLVGSEAGSPRGHGDTHTQSQEGLVAFGLATDDADGAGAPQVLDQPAMFGRLQRQLMRWLDRKAAHEA